MATLKLLQFPVVRRPKWSDGELSEFFRVQNALNQVGLEVEVEKGLTDEGDPWFVFCRSNGDSVVEILRSDGFYTLSASVLPEPLRGRNFSELARRLIELMPLPVRPETGKLLLHPSSLLSILVASLFVTLDLLNSAPASAQVEDGTTNFKSAGVRTAERSAEATFLMSGKSPASHLDADRREFPQAQLPQMILSEALVIGVFIAAKLTTNQLHLSSPSAEMPVAPDSLHGNLSAHQSRPTVEVSAHLAAETQTGEPNRNGAGSSNVQLPEPTGWHVVETNEHPKLVGAAPPSAASPPLNYRSIEQDQTFPASVEFPDGRFHQTSGQATLAHAPSSPQYDLHERGAVLQLTGGASFRIAESGTENISEGPFLLRVTSVGDLSNSIMISDSLISDGRSVAVVVSGTQDIEVFESISVYLRSTLDTSDFNADLSLGIIFGNDTSSIETLSLGRSDFHLRPGDSISLYELPDETSIQVNVGVRALSMVAVGAATTKDASLYLSLGSESSSLPLSFDDVRVFGVDDLHLRSLSSSEDTIYTVESLRVADLSSLTLSGNAGLVIRQLQVASLNGGDVSIDARALNASLVVTFAEHDQGDGDSQVTVYASSRGTAFFDMNADDRVRFYGGEGVDVFGLSAGDINDMVQIGHHDEVLLNGWSILESITPIDELSSSFQNVIDSQTELTDAAEAAAHLYVFGHVNPTGHTAWLFSYHGSDFIFADENGNGHFNSSSDAIVGLIGAAPGLASVL